MKSTRPDSKKNNKSFETLIAGHDTDIRGMEAVKRTIQSIDDIENSGVSDELIRLAKNVFFMLLQRTAEELDEADPLLDKYKIVRGFEEYLLEQKLKKRDEIAKSIVSEIVAQINEFDQSQSEAWDLWQDVVGQVNKALKYPESDPPKSSVAGSVLAAPPEDSNGEVPPDGQLYVTHKKPEEDIVGFLDRVYGQRGLLTGEFTRADLGRIDPSARTALDNWERKTATRPKRRAPLNLPTLKEFNDRALAAAPSLVRPEAAREYDRVRALVKRRNLD